MKSGLFIARRRARRAEQKRREFLKSGGRGRGTTYKMSFLPKIQLNIVLSDHNVEKTVEAISRAARKGKEGDGIIFIYPVEDVVRIRTGERDTMP